MLSLATHPSSGGPLSDKALLDALSLSESEAATILGRTRQSLYQAGLSTRSNYFKVNDLRSLVFEARGRNKDLNMEPILAYVEQSRGRDVAEAIRAVGAHEADTVDMSSYSEIWVVLPDVAWLNRSHPDSLKRVIELGALPGVRTHYFTASSMDEKLLVNELGKVGILAPEVTAQDWMGAIPPLFIGNPQQKADIYLFSNGRFTSNDWYGGSKLVMLIQKLVAQA